MHQSLELRLGVLVASAKQHEGQRASQGVPATGRGKPLKAEAQGRYRHETRPEGRGWNQGVRRLRKPGGAAQPGEANPVQVAARALKRRRATNPTGGPLANPSRLVGLEDREQAVSVHTLDARRRAREDGVAFASHRFTHRRPRRSGFMVSLGAQGHGGSAQPIRALGARTRHSGVQSNAMRGGARSGDRA